MAKKPKAAEQWKILCGISLERLAGACEQAVSDGWQVFSILGPFSDGFAVVVRRMLTL